MNQFKLTLLLIHASILVCNNCHSQDNTFYQIINDLVQDSTMKVDLVISEINVVHKYSELLEDTAKNNGQITPPTFGVIYYNKEYFRGLKDSGLIQNEDVDYMYNQINGIYGSKLDSSMVEKQVVPLHTCLSTNERSAKKLSFIRFSDPIYVQNKKSVLLSVWINERRQLREKTLFLKLVDGKWIISTVISERII